MPQGRKTGKTLPPSNFLKPRKNKGFRKFLGGGVFGPAEAQLPSRSTTAYISAALVNLPLQERLAATTLWCSASFPVE